MNLEKSATNEKFIRQLADMLAACPIDGTLSYEQMTRALGFDPRRRRHLIVSALRLANAESGVVTRAIPAQGYQRLRDGVSAGASALNKARRATRRGRVTVSNWMDKTNLDDDQLRRAFATVTQLSIVEHLSNRRAAPDLSKADLSNHKIGVDVKTTLDAIKKSREARAG